LADTVGFAPLFACLGAFDLIGAVWLYAMRRHLMVPQPPQRPDPHAQANLANPPVFAVSAQARGTVTLTADTGAIAHVFVVEEDIIRVLLLADGTPPARPAGPSRRAPATSPNRAATA
jgi:hypothetical protein